MTVTETLSLCEQTVSGKVSAREETGEQFNRLFFQATGDAGQWERRSPRKPIRAANRLMGSELQGWGGALREGEDEVIATFA